MMDYTNTHTLIIGDARGAVKKLGGERVQLVVTSPPYWSIKDYGVSDQIGAEQSYKEYIGALTGVFSDCLNALSPGCRLAINVGEQYLRASEHGSYGIAPIPADLILSLSKKAAYLGSIIWRKISTTKTTGGCAWMGSIYHPRDGYITYEHEYILLFKKPGTTPAASKELREASRLTKEQRSKWFRGVWDDVAPARQKVHLAMFPVELPERLIRMFTFAGETVLDPFGGSGTTAIAAQAAGRNSVCVELNPEFESLYRDRFGGLELGFELKVLK